MARLRWSKHILEPAPHFSSGFDHQFGCPSLLLGSSAGSLSAIESLSLRQAFVWIRPKKIVLRTKTIVLRTKTTLSTKATCRRWTHARERPHTFENPAR
jgi:hypothetical protein